jgi:DNA polymerase elongation subunit (family B)
MFLFYYDQFHHISYLVPFTSTLSHVRTTQPYSMRVSIDLDLRVGSWYIVRTVQGTEACTVQWQKDMLELCEPKILAFDIECEKAGKENEDLFMFLF